MDFTFQTTEGAFCYPHDLQGGWGLFFYYGGDFLPVSVTELFALAALFPALRQCGCRVLAISADSLAVHLAFLESLSRHRRGELPFGLAADPEGEFRRRLGGAAGQKYLWLTDPQGKVQACFCYPAAIGANFTEAHRTLLALQTDRPTPADWVPEAYTLALPPQTRKESLKFMQSREERGDIALDWYFSFEIEPSAD